MEHHERADELEREADKAEEASDRLEEDMEGVRSDWEAKQSDAQVPGAVEPKAAGPQNIDAEDPATRDDDEE